MQRHRRLLADHAGHADLVAVEPALVLVLDEDHDAEQCAVQHERDVQPRLLAVPVHVLGVGRRQVCVDVGAGRSVPEYAAVPTYFRFIDATGIEHQVRRLAGRRTSDDRPADDKQIVNQPKKETYKAPHSPGPYRYGEKSQQCCEFVAMSSTSDVPPKKRRASSDVAKAKRVVLVSVLHR